MSRRNHQTLAGIKTTPRRFGFLAFLLLAALSLASCEHEQTSPSSHNSAGFGLSLVAPPEGKWKEIWDTSSDSTLHAYLYKLGESDEAPYAVRPHPDDGTTTPESQGTASAGEELVLEVRRPNTPSWYRLFVRLGDVGGQSTFRLSSADREREVWVVTAPNAVTADQLVVFSGLAAESVFPHLYGSESGDVVLFPIGIQNPNPLDGLRMRFSLDVDQTPRFVADPGSRLYSSYAAFDTLAFQWDIDLISPAEADCNIFELVISPFETQATIPAGSDVLFYLEGDGSNETNGICVDRNHVFFSISGTEQQLDASNVTNITDCIFSNCDLVLTNPVADDHLCVGDTTTITWSSTGCCGEQVGIELLKDGAVCEILADQTPNDGSYNWAVTTCGESPAGYALRITDPTSGAQDVTGGTFDINPGCSLSVLYPNGGEMLCENRNVDITWNAASCCGDSVRIELLLGGFPCATLVDATDNDGSYTWTVTRCVTSHPHAETGYIICVTDLDGDVIDYSDESFDILPECSITITAPTLGTTVCDESTVEISWSSASCCGNSVSLDLLAEGEFCGTIISLTDNDGSFSWGIDEPCTFGDNFTIRATDLSTGVETQSATFSILAACEMSLTVPVDGAVLCEEQSISIQWTASSCCASSVTLELLQDGAVCDTLASTAPNSGSYLWTVQGCGANTDGYTLQVTDETSGVSTVSGAPFRILPACEMSLTNPVGGVTLCSEEPLDITWTWTECCGDQITLSLLQDGLVCSTIAQSIANDGSFEWTPSPCDGEGGYTIRIADDSSGTSIDMAGTFTIETGCSLQVISPTEATSYCNNDNIAIRWTRSDCCGDSVKIELVLNNESCQTIASSTVNDGSYDWPAQPCGEITGQYTVKITDKGDGTEALSEGFWIHPVCSLVVTQPSALDRLCIGGETEITWNASTCCGDSVDIELYYSGSSIVGLALATPNDGSFTWTVAELDPLGPGYTVQITDLGTEAWTQSGIFNIEPSCTLSIQDPALGDSLCAGNATTIVWDYSECCGDSVSILALHNNEVYLTIAERVPNTGEFAWSPVRSGQFSEGYSLRIFDLPEEVVDETGLFTILPSCILAVTYPTASQLVFCEDDTLPITWNSSSCCGSLVALDLYRQGAYCQSIATGTDNDGLYPWVVSQCDDESAQYTIQVSDLTSLKTDASDNAFTINPACTINVTDPFGGGLLLVGVEIAIGWERGVCCGNLVKLELLNGGTVCKVIAESTANDTGEPWTVERCGTVEDGYTFRVTDLTTGAYGITPDTYSILQVAPCVINVTEPAGDSSYDQGQNVLIRWTADVEYCGDTVRLDLMDAGEQCALIEASANNDGRYTWDALPCAGYSNDYAIRVRDNDTYHYDLSPEFEIIPDATPCSLDLEEPNGGEAYSEGQAVTISWVPLGDCGSVVHIDLLYNGDLCIPITSSAENSGSYAWFATSCDGLGDALTIQIVDPSTGTVEESDEFFTVAIGKSGPANPAPRDPEE